MAYKNTSFSRFAHALTRGNDVALFHALKLKPLYIDLSIYERIQSIVASPEILSEDDVVSLENGPTVLSVMDHLIDNRVLNTSEGRDDEVINAFQNRIDGLKIRIAYFILAENCNLACRYCFERVPTHSLSTVMMTKETALKSIQFFEKMLSLHPSETDEKDIIFYGGEPLLNYSTLIFTLNEIKERERCNPSVWGNTRLSLVTNGTLLDKERIAELHSYGLGIGVSIDGPEEITNANRFYADGRGAYSDTIRSIGLCREMNVPFSLSITLSEAAVKEPHEIIRFVESVSPSSIGFNILMGENDSMPHQEYNEAATYLIINAFKQFRETGLFEDRMMRKVKYFSRQEVYPFDCGATGGSQIVLAPSGQVGICHGYLAEKKYFPTTIDNLRFDPSSDSTYKAWAKRTPLHMPECQDCFALGICGGGCPMNAERTNGSIYALDERFCIHAKKVLEWLVWDLCDNAAKSHS